MRVPQSKSLCFFCVCIYKRKIETDECSNQRTNHKTKVFCSRCSDSKEVGCDESRESERETMTVNSIIKTIKLKSSEIGPEITLNECTISSVLTNAK